MNEFSPCRLLKVLGSSLVTASFLMVPSLIDFGNFEMGLVGTAHAKKGVCKDGTAPPCKPGGGGEPVGSNNLSYPVIWSDDVLRPDFTSSDAPWTFAEITNPATQCVQQDQLVSTVPDTIACYYGEKNLGIDEATGDRTFEPPVKIWWLQQRQLLDNTWQAFNIRDADAEAAAGATGSTPVVITGVDTGDLLESSITIKAKQVRTEFTLFKRVQGSTLGNAVDPDYTGFLVTNGCVLNDNTALAPNNCFAAHNMSGAVPGTDQSINEIQGTDYGDLTQGGLLDPQAVKVVNNYFDPTVALPPTEAEEPGDPRIIPVEPPVGMDATVYSHCARLVIQPITDPTLSPVWSSDAMDGVASGEHGGYWTNGLEPPVVDVAAWDTTGATPSGTYSAEINAGGSVIFGYNWNTKLLAAKGDYRITFVLEGPASCDVSRNTVFDGTTKSVNVGERRPAQVVSDIDMGVLGASGGEGGLVFVDVNVGASGGGGGRNK